MMHELLDKTLTIDEARGYWRDWSELQCQNPECRWRVYRKWAKKHEPELLKKMRCPECGSDLKLEESIQEDVAVATKDPTQAMRSYYKNIINGPLKPSTWSGEEWYKFWLLKTGEYIPVKHSHARTSAEANVGAGSLERAGALAGSVDMDTGSMNLDGEKRPNKRQISRLKQMYVQYKPTALFMEISEWTGGVKITSVDELDYALNYGIDESIQESSIDYPKSDLDLSVWEKEEEGYILRPEVKDKIFKTLDAYEPIDLLDIAREIRIVGSMGSNLYAEDADIDVHLVPNDFSEWDEDKVQEVKKWFIAHAQELGAFVGKHPIEVYVQLDPVQDLLSAGVYDIFADEWLVGPKLVSKDYDPYEDFSHIADDIRQNVQDADILMGELKRDVIDYDVISKAMGEMPADVKKRLHLKLKNKLSEIEKDIEGMYAKRKEWTDARKEASKPKTPEEALKNVELAKKWRDTNAVFKFINRYQYLKVIQDLEELIADDGVVSPDEVDVIRNIVGV